MIVTASSLERTVQYRRTMSRAERALLFMVPFVVLSGLAKYAPFGVSPAAAIESREVPSVQEEALPPATPETDPVAIEPLDLVSELQSITWAARTEVASNESK